METVTTTQADEMAQPDLDLRAHRAEALTARDLVKRAIRFANQPAAKNWWRLEGGEVVESEAATQYPMPEVARAAERLQAALSAIAHGTQTAKDLAAWKAATSSMRIIPDFIVEGRRIRTELTWWVPREVIEWPESSALASSGWLFVSTDISGLLATALMLLLDPDQPFSGLRECGLGAACDRERFYFRKRKYCCPEHWPDRKADWKERQKAVRELAKQLPGGSATRAQKLVSAVKDRGLKCEELVQRALASLKKAAKHK